MGSAARSSEPNPLTLRSVAGGFARRRRRARCLRARCVAGLRRFSARRRRLARGGLTGGADGAIGIGQRCAVGRVRRTTRWTWRRCAIGRVRRTVGGIGQRRTVGRVRRTGSRDRRASRRAHDGRAVGSQRRRRLRGSFRAGLLASGEPGGGPSARRGRAAGAAGRGSTVAAERQLFRAQLELRRAAAEEQQSERGMAQRSLHPYVFHHESLSGDLGSGCGLSP